MSTDRLTIERLPKGRVVATLRVEEAEYAPAEQEALQQLAGSVDLKGFRPGHAPLDMVRSKVNPDALFEESIRMILRRELPQIIQGNTINPVIPPKVEVVTRMPLVIKITFVERPEVTVKNGDTIKVTKKDTKADPKDVEKVIQSVLQDQRITTETSEVAKTGDQVTVDFHATDDQNKEIEGLRAVGYGALLGSNTLLPGFEDALVGLKKGNTKSFTLTLPEKFQAENLRGKPATFHVTMQKVENVQLPELTDSFAKEKLQAESVAAFRTMVEKSIEQQEEQFQRMSRERELMEEIRKRTTVELADELLEEEVRSIIDEWAARLEKQGTTIADALQKEGKTPEQAEKEMKEEAMQRWKLRLGIAKLIEERKITLSPEELDSAFQAFLQGVPQEKQDEARKEWEQKGGLYEEVRWRSMVDKLIESLLV